MLHIVAGTASTSPATAFAVPSDLRVMRYAIQPSSVAPPMKMNGDATMPNLYPDAYAVRVFCPHTTDALYSPRPSTTTASTTTSP